MIAKMLKKMPAGKGNNTKSFGKGQVRNHNAGNKGKEA